MSEVMAGLLVGYALSFAAAPALAIALLRLRVRSSLLAAVLPAQVPVIALAVALYWFTFALWALVGALLGLVLGALEAKSPDGGLGSPNLAFTFLVLAVTLALAGPPLILARSIRRHVIAAAAILVGAFGWLMPYLAQWSRFGSS